MSNSQEEEIARNYICFGNPDATVVVLDATCLERNLNLVFQVMEITPNVIVCVNLLDEAKKKGVSIDLSKLSKLLGVPVVGTTARKKKTLTKLLQTINDVCTQKIIPKPNIIKYLPVIEDSISILTPEISSLLASDTIHLCRWICLKLIDEDANIIYSIEKNLNINLSKNNSINNKLLEIYDSLSKNDLYDSNLKDKIVSTIIHTAENISKTVTSSSSTSRVLRDQNIDKILTSKKFGIPIMLFFLAIIFWITIVGANYPSQLLSSLFMNIQDKLLFSLNAVHSPDWLTDILINGMYRTVTWVIAVMLPPMAIFFPIFTFLEDLGYLPRIAFNLDNYFKKACSSGKQALTMCMGFGCNAAGVVGCRIIDSPREKLIAILTNSFVPCNRKISFFDYYF